MGFVQGVNRGQIRMLALDDMVAEKAMVRVIDRFIEVTDLEALGFERTTPAWTGRPAYAPKALAKLYVYGYENGIRSSRKLERETRRNVEAMWLVEGVMPDYKTIAEFRKNNLRPLQKLLREFVKLCKSWDLIGGELVAVDGSKVKASNSKKNNFSRKKLDTRLAKLDEQIAQHLSDMEQNDSTETDTEVPSELKKLLERKELYEAYKKQLDESGENEQSVVDPDARLMSSSQGSVDVAYNVQSAVDGKHDIVVAFDVSMNPSDHHQLGPMVKKVKRILKARRFTVLADKGYYNGKDLRQVKRYKVTAIVARQRPNDSKKFPAEYRSEKFTYQAESDTYTCPMGHSLSCKSKKTDRKRYRNIAACASCPNNSECITGQAKYRTITHNQYAVEFEEADRRLAQNQALYRRRQQIVEHPFGTIKRTMDGGYFLLRTRRKVRTEVALLFLGYNLKRAVKVLGFEGIMARLDAISRTIICFCHEIVGRQDKNPAKRGLCLTNSSILAVVL